MPWVSIALAIITPTIFAAVGLWVFFTAANQLSDNEGELVKVAPKGEEAITTALVLVVGFLLCVCRRIAERVVTAGERWGVLMRERVEEEKRGLG